MCVSVCVSLASDSSETIEVIIIKLGTVTALDMLMHQVLIILTLTSIQGHTDLNHESNGRLMRGMHTHAHFDDLDLDPDFENIRKANLAR